MQAYQKTSVQLFVSVCALLVFECALANKEPWEEYEKLVKRSQTISPHGANPVGESISLQSGALSFSATDVSIPSSQGLPVAFIRTFSTKTRGGFVPGGPRGDTNIADAPLGDWDVDIPNISAVYAVSTGWPGTRCSVPAAANDVTVKSGNYSAYFKGHDIWSGTSIRLSGGGSGALLVRSSAAPKPDGVSSGWIGPGFAAVSCLPSTKNGAPGEGFSAIDKNGVKYTFDWMAQSSEMDLAHKPPKTASWGQPSYIYLQRAKYSLYVSRIEDVHGNWVSYSYSNAFDKPIRPTRIEASDGRLITISYLNDRVEKVTAEWRVWQYGYSAAGALTEVTLPDLTKWQIDLPNFNNIAVNYELDETTRRPIVGCDRMNYYDRFYFGSLQHPSGVKVSFKLAPQLFERRGIDYATNCAIGDPDDPLDDAAWYPMAWVAYSVVSKTVEGPGLDTATWSFEYFSGDSTEVTGPGDFARYTYGNNFRVDEGLLLKVEKGTAKTSVLETQVSEYELAQSAMPYATPVGISLQVKAPEFSD